MGTIQYGEKTEVSVNITNTGESILVVEEISANCNCVTNTKKYPQILPDSTKKIRFQVTPDTPGSYFKKVFVFCNSKDSPFLILVKGMAEF